MEKVRKRKFSFCETNVSKVVFNSDAGSKSSGFNSMFSFNNRILQSAPTKLTLTHRTKMEWAATFL